MRGSARADSDVDILVSFDGPATSSRYFGVQVFLEDLLGRRVDLVTDKALRPELHGLTVTEVESVLTDMAQHAIMLTSVVAPPAPNSGDQLLRELLAARANVLLVTGDKLLLRDAKMRGRVISPLAFVASL